MKKLDNKGFEITGISLVLIVFIVVVAISLGVRRRVENGQAESRGKHYSVHIIAGQSNAVGWGSNPREIDKSDADEKIKFYYSHETDSGGKIVKIKAQGIPRSRYGSGFGPEVRLSRQLYRNGYKNVYIIKVGRGATSMYKDWNPVHGSIYKKYMNDEIDKALRQIRLQGSTYSVDGFYWTQGESDMNAAGAAGYEQSLKAFIASVRNKFGKPNLKFIIARSNYPSAEEPYRSIVRKAQSHVANITPNVLWVDTDDIKLSDFVHYDSNGEFLLGQRFANKIMPYMEKTYPNGLK